MTLDPQLREFLAQHADDPDLSELSLTDLRHAVEEERAFNAPAPDVALVRNLTIPTPAGGVAARLYRPSRRAALPLVVLFHGGGWVLGSVELMDPLARWLAAEAEVAVLSATYRLAPEHIFPAAIDDAYEILNWTAAHASELGGDPDRLAIAGESSGGNLAAAVALRARDDSGPRIVHQLLIQPAMDADFDTASYREFATGYLLSRAAMQRFWATYLGLPVDLVDARIEGVSPYAAPLRADDLTGLPSATVLTMECDPLRDEGEAYAARLSDAGVPTVLTRFPGLTHGALLLDGVVPRAADVRQAASAALRRVFGVDLR